MTGKATGLEDARQAYDAHEWERARAAYAGADEDTLAPQDLEHLAIASHMVGDNDEFVAALERAHGAYLDAGDPRPAIRCAFWLGLIHAERGEMAQASGWMGRAGRLAEDESEDCAEKGLMLLPTVIQALGSGDFKTAGDVAGRAAEIGRRFDDRDLATLALHAQGLSRVKAGQMEEGLRLLDEAMVAVVADELSPMVTGIVYCSVIEGCRDVYELQRAKEWTSALARWCDGQPDLVAFSGECLLYRADLLRLSGSWSDSLAEAERAQGRFKSAEKPRLTARASYQQAEVLRCRGELEAAEALFTQASRGGYEPQPGLALLRLAQGETEAAASAIRRATGETRNPLERARLLPAYVEITLAAEDLEAARSASDELAVIAEAHGTEMLGALAATADGAVSLAAGDGLTALSALRNAAQLWLGLDAPYEAARVRELIGRACIAVGDVESAELELEAAREAFRRLGAGLDEARANALRDDVGSGRAGGSGAADEHGLTERELEVLRLVAAGKSNREIAAELVISEHTVARHLQNLFAKLDVSSRTAAGAYAYEHGLT